MDTAASALALPPGVWVWYWPKGPGGWGDAAAVAARLVALGGDARIVAGVIPQASLYAPAWTARHRAAFESAGLLVTPALGMDGDHGAEDLAAATRDALGAFGRCGWDWESPKRWESPGGNALAQRLVDAVADAPGDVVDFPWWAPLSMRAPAPDGAARLVATHPHAPTRILGARCNRGRWVQAYGSPRDGRSASMLAWARDLSQYPALGTPAEAVMPAHQGYGRSVPDHVATLTAEPVVCVWDLMELDARARAGFAAVAALATRGFRGPGACRAFQAAEGLAADGACGPKTCAALGVAWPTSP